MTMELPLQPVGGKRVGLEQRLGEADGYYHLLRGQIQVWKEGGREGGREGECVCVCVCVCYIVQVL